LPAAGALSAHAVTFSHALTMTTLQKTLVAAALAAVAGLGWYEARQASYWRDLAQSPERQQAALSRQIESLTAANQALSNQLTQIRSSASFGTDRLRELLRLRGEVGVLRRQQQEFEQARTRAGSSEARTPKTATAGPNAPAPFQVQLVADEPGADTETLTNNATGSNGQALHLNKTPLLDYTAIQSVAVGKDPASGTFGLNLELSSEGKDLFAAVTREHLNRRLAIVVNGQLQMAPVIRSEISGGKLQITGNFTEDEARQLAEKIRGAIPTPGGTSSASP
jgi:hypothetical protein